MPSRTSTTEVVKGRLRIKADCLVIIANCLDVMADSIQRLSAVEIEFRIIRTKSNGFIEVQDGLLHLAVGVPKLAANHKGGCTRDVTGGIIGLQIDKRIGQAHCLRMLVLREP